MYEYDRREGIAHIARQAGKILLEAIPDRDIVIKEGVQNFYTAADLASEKAIIDFIHENYSGDAVISEETASDITDPLTVNRLWVVDPLDGTNNFRYQRNYSCVSIGYVEKGKVQMGAVYNPFRNELFYAEKSKGAFVNGRKIQTAQKNELAKAVVGTDVSYDPAVTRAQLETFLKLQPTPWVLIRACAVLAMCEVASGRMDLYFHRDLKPWDNAAGMLIAQEAGALVTTMDRSTPSFMSSGLVIGNPSLVEQFFQQVR